METLPLKNRGIAERRHPFARLALVCVLAVAGPVLAAESTDPASVQGNAEPSYSDSWSLDVGVRVPLLAAQDQSGTRRELADLVGRKGLLLVLVRSADW